MPIPDDFKHTEKGIDSPYDYGVDVSPHDTNELAFKPRALYVGGAGNLVARWHDGTTTTFNSVPAGTVLRIRPIGVNATSTTATNIRALK